MNIPRPHLFERQDTVDVPEVLSPASENAHRWIGVSQRVLTERIKQYIEVGNTKAANDLQDLHQATLDMLRDGVERHDEGFIAMLSRLEEDLLGGTSPELQPPNYGVGHALQLDQIARSVRQAQETHDAQR